MRVVLVAGASRSPSSTAAGFSRRDAERDRRRTQRFAKHTSAKRSSNMSDLLRARRAQRLLRQEPHLARRIARRRQGRARRAPRAQRRRQDDDDAQHPRPDAAPLRLGRPRRARHHGLAGVPHRAFGRRLRPRRTPDVQGSHDAREPAARGERASGRLVDRARPGASARSSRNCVRARPDGFPAASRRCSRSVARSVSNPTLLLVDEPSQGLAPMIVEEVYHILEEMKARGVSILARRAERAARPEDCRPRLRDGRRPHRLRRRRRSSARGHGTHPHADGPDRRRVLAQRRHRSRLSRAFSLSPPLPPHRRPRARSGATDRGRCGSARRPDRLA